MNRIATIAASLCVAAPGLAQPIDTPNGTIGLTSAHNDTLVNPGQTIEWSVVASIAPGTHRGLAGFGFDLVQSSGPAGILLEPADVVPAAMSSFRRPAGLASAGVGGIGDGFPGTVVANAFGGADLVSIGGAQNSFGVALPTTAGFATVATVVPDLAIDPVVQPVASGHFLAPTRVGSYELVIGRVAAAAFATVGAPPAVSVTTPCRIISVGSVRFVIVCRADFNGDGAVTLQDLFDFLAAYFAGDPSADVNNQDGVTVQDLFEFLASYFIGCEF